MNMLKKMTVVVLGAATLGLTAFVCAEAPRGHDVTAAMATVDQQVARDLTEQMQAALAAPRTFRLRQEPSVSVTEVADLVVVAATRLPSLDPLKVARVARAAQARL